MGRCLLLFYSHGGAFVGFRAELMRFPDQRFTVAIFTNRGDANPTRMARKIADIMLKDELVDEAKAEGANEEDSESAETNTSSAVTQIELDQLIGEYEIEPGVVFKITEGEELLHVVQGWNGSSYEIKRNSGNTFLIVGQDNISFTFSDLKENSTQTLIIDQDGRITTCKRKEKINLATLNLPQYIGEFKSDEMMVTYSLFMEKEELKLRIGNGESMNCIYIEENKFSTPFGMLQFKRNEAKISHFLLDSGRVKNLKFIKQ